MFLDDVVDVLGGRYVKGFLTDTGYMEVLTVTAELTNSAKMNATT